MNITGVHGDRFDMFFRKTISGENALYIGLIQVINVTYSFNEFKKSQQTFQRQFWNFENEDLTNCTTKLFCIITMLIYSIFGKTHFKMKVYGHSANVECRKGVPEKIPIDVTS